MISDHTASQDVADPLAQVRQLSRRHTEVAELGVGRFSNAMWAAIRRDRAGSFRELDEARTSDDPWTRNLAVMVSAMFRENEGDVENMAADLEIALTGFQEIGDRYGISRERVRQIENRVKRKLKAHLEEHFPDLRGADLTFV